MTITEVKDFFNCNEISFVEIKFYDLDDIDKVTFRKYLDNEGNIKVRKITGTDLKFNYHGYLQQVEEEWLNLNNSSTFTVPSTAILPRSFLSKSAIINNSARSFSL